MQKLLGAIVFLGLMVVIFAAISQYASPTGPAVQSEMQDITNKVATDAVDQYRIVARSGGAMERCSQAMMVTAAFLQAKNETQYSSWKIVEHRDCKAAGMPQ